MDQTMDAYIYAVLEQRDWSWTVMAILFIAVGLLVRMFVLQPVLRKAKEVGRKDYSEMKRHYLRRALWGWIFFALSVLFAIILWRNPVTVPLEGDEFLVLLGAVISFLLSLIFHLLALGVASLIVLETHSQINSKS